MQRKARYSGPYSVSAYNGHQRLAQGHITEVALQLKRTLSEADLATVLVFDDATSDPIELDMSGTEAAVLSRLPALPGSTGDGESQQGGNTHDSEDKVSQSLMALLNLEPSQIAWLQGQGQPPGIVIKALIANAMEERLPRQHRSPAEAENQAAKAAALRSINALAKALPGCDEAIQALHQNDAARFRLIISSWPRGLALHLKKLSDDAFV
ncbi:DUF2239 family protein [Microbulbifer sp.]|uniref:DUF2239 family protein n=1 Tax=Microbulbifer sp. TaxID=1908541 RepID=UPI0025876A97|nr:DUF2239 family protein [Microbulbifer sp.]